MALVGLIGSLERSGRSPDAPAGVCLHTCRPSFCPPSAPGVPHRWSGQSSRLREPLGPAVPLNEYGGGGALVGSRAQGPPRPLLSSSSLAARGAGLAFAEMSLCLVSASGSRVSRRGALCAPLLGFSEPG